MSSAVVSITVNTAAPVLPAVPTGWPALASDSGIKGTGSPSPPPSFTGTAQPAD